MDLIDRDEVIKALRLEYPMMPMFKSLREEWAIKTEGFRRAEEVIMKLPSVKSMEMVGEERPKGEWKHLKGDEWLCSNCGYVVWTEGSWEHPLERGKDYCEHCGANMTMKGADDE